MAATVVKLKKHPLYVQAARERLRAYLAGQITFAQAEDMTCEEAQQIAAIGCELAARGRLHDARVVFEGLVAGNPKDTSAQAALGAVYQRLNRPQDALCCYHRALELFDGNVVAFANRGELRLKAKDLGGLDDLRKATELDPRAVTAAGRRARALIAFLLERTRRAASTAKPVKR